MPDNKNIRGPADSKKINVNEDYELAYWTKELGVTEKELRAAVTAAGTDVAEVRTHLGK